MYLDNFLLSLSNSLPTAIGALLLLFIGWIFAKAVSSMVHKKLKATNWEQKWIKN